MTISEEEAAYYLRFISMYIDLGSEVLLKVFIHHTPEKDAETFLLSNTLKIQQLKNYKILNKQECDLVLTSPPNVQAFGVSLLIKLSMNLLSQLPPPKKGWFNPPKKSDQSISADLLRLRSIRNFVIGHRAKAQLPHWRFEDEWKIVQEIFLRIYRNIAPDEETQLKQRIEEYRLRKLDPSIENKYDSKWREWQQEISEIQQKVEDAFKTVEDIDKYLNSKSDRYERYIKLLFKGGRFVILALVENNLKAQNKDLRVILKDKEDNVRKIIDNPDQLRILYPPSQWNSSDPIDMSTWDITLLVLVLLKVLDNSSLDDEAQQAIIDIDTARKGYAEAAVVSFDSDAFAEYSYPLNYNIRFLSRYLDSKKKLECEAILSEFKRISEGTDTHQTYFDELKKQSINMKSIQEIYKDQIKKTKHVLQEMITQGIDFKQKHVMESKIITLGCDENKKQLGEKVLTTIWQEALERSGDSNEFDVVKNEVSNILKEITELKMTTHGYDTEKKWSEETLPAVREQALERRGDRIDVDVVKKEVLKISKDMTDQRAFDLRENVISESAQPSYRSKYESEFVHKLVLGSGAFGVVFKAENRVDKRSYAVKRITLHTSDTLQDNINREVTALSNLEHSNIVRYFQAWPETPPPGWQEQKDHQRGISESSSSFILSSASRVNKADTDDGSPSPNTTPQKRDGDNNTKEPKTLLCDPFGTADPFQILSFSPREGSDSWGSDNGTTSAESSERQKPEERYTKERMTSKKDQQNKKLETKIKQIEPSVNKDMNKNKLFLYIQMELCKPETLKQWLDENIHERSSEKQKVLDWFNQICSAVKYMHENQFVHRDLKPSNIFFSAKDVVKVGDFGFATALEEDQYLETYSEAGTYLYMAQEVLEKCHKKSNKVDIYSLGVILFELLYSFGTQNERIKTLGNIRKLQFPESFKGDMPEKERLVSKMLAKIPEERPSAEEILNEIMKTAAP